METFRINARETFHESDRQITDKIVPNIYVNPVSFITSLKVISINFAKYDTGGIDINKIYDTLKIADIIAASPAQPPDIICVQNCLRDMIKNFYIDTATTTGNFYIPISN